MSYRSLAPLKDNKQSQTSHSVQVGHFEITRAIVKWPQVVVCYIIEVSLKNLRIYQLWTTVLKLGLRLQHMFKCVEYANLQCIEVQLSIVNVAGQEKDTRSAMASTIQTCSFNRVCCGIFQSSFRPKFYFSLFLKSFQAQLKE